MIKIYIKKCSTCGLIYNEGIKCDFCDLLLVINFNMFDIDETPVSFKGRTEDSESSDFSSNLKAGAIV